MKVGNSVTKVALIAFALGLSAAALSAQTTTGGDVSQPAEPTLKISQENALKSFEPPADAEYEIGPGDEISIDFPGHSELTTRKIVGPDGRISLPLAGSIHIADLSRTAAAQAIVDKLTPNYTNLVATVSVDKYSSNRVRVVGYVLHPGEIPFEDTPTLLDAISRAGLISSSSDRNGVASTANAIPETCTIYRGNDTTVSVDLRKLLMSGSALADLRLRRNDIVYVPSPKELFVSVLGEVAKPGNIQLTPSSTLRSVLADAGCCGEGGGFSPNIRVIQPSIGKDTTINYKQLISLGGTEITLHSGDVIVIPKTGFYKATYFLQRISPVATMVSLATLVGAG